MIQLSHQIGRVGAHRFLHEISSHVGEIGTDLGMALRERMALDPTATTHALNTYVAAAQEMIEQVLQAVSQNHPEYNLDRSVA